LSKEVQTLAPHRRLQSNEPAQAVIDGVVVAVANFN